jgi:hypothetical protein
VRAAAAIAGSLAAGAEGPVTGMSVCAGLPGIIFEAAAWSVDITSLSAFSQYSIAIPCWRPADSHIM